jgi:LAO/AO transport system kinase
MWQQLREQLQAGDQRALARLISMVENEQPGYEDFLTSLPPSKAGIVLGVTGPPGAGKSSLVNRMVEVLAPQGKKLGILCVDPSSPFNMGAVLGDRIRMSEWYLHPNVFIRSLASRGSVGGLHPKILEITDLMKAAGCDYIIVETVGVGQSEIEIAGLADITIVVLVPEAGDEIQTMKSGLMEIADLFVINKTDRAGADELVRNLRQMLAPVFHKGSREVPIVKTSALNGEGMTDLFEAVSRLQSDPVYNDRKVWLLTERIFHLIQQQRMRNVDKSGIASLVREQLAKGDFNLHALARTLT